MKISKQCVLTFPDCWNSQKNGWKSCLVACAFNFFLRWWMTRSPILQWHCALHPEWYTFTRYTVQLHPVLYCYVHLK